MRSGTDFVLRTGFGLWCNDPSLRNLGLKKVALRGSCEMTEDIVGRQESVHRAGGRGEPSAKLVMTPVAEDREPKTVSNASSFEADQRLKAQHANRPASDGVHLPELDRALFSPRKIAVVSGGANNERPHNSK